MRKLNIGTDKLTVVFSDNEQAVSEYTIVSAEDPGRIFATLSFQDGPIKEAGINGCHNEDLIAIVLDRLTFFQQGPFSCRENALAITKLEEALHWLNHRTQERIRRGIEGTHTA